jgi:hypothetical protein
MLSRSDPFNRFTPWIAAVGLIGSAGFFFIPLNTGAEQPSPDRLAFEGQTTKPLGEVAFCLSKDWGSRLALRPRLAPSSNMARLTNSVRHYTIDVIDEGSVRKLRAYSRRGGPFSKREIEALDGCLTGRAFALGTPRNS